MTKARHMRPHMHNTLVLHNLCKYCNNISLKTTFLAYISAAATTFTQSALKATEFSEITQPLGLLRSSRSFKVTEFGTNRKPICDFLLVINSNLPPVLHRFRDITSQRSKIDTFFYHGLTPDGGVPLGRSP